MSFRKMHRAWLTGHRKQRRTVPTTTQGKAECSALVVDDMALLRLGMTAVLEPIGVDVVADTAMGRDVPQLCADHSPDIVLLGHVTDLPPADVVQRIRALEDPPLILALLVRTHREELAALLALDVNGLIVRSVQGDELALSVERVLKGERVVAPALLSALVGAVSASEPEAEALLLTRREREVLVLVAEGRANREIADELFVTLATVKTHVAHVYAKLGAKNRNEAIGRAIALGLLG